ncbi:MAG TPA: hypothetical protein VK517_04005 [Cyclobacteriaceae bacterium]|nr:hypothetical protein [Cyclobacteriaceae bacterium]
MIQTLLHLSLVVHIIAISMVVGITIANFVAFKQFWKLYAVNHEQGLSAFRAITNFQFIGMIGLLLLIVSGTTMLYIVEWTFLSLLWFKIKLSIILLIFVNGFTMGRIQTVKLQAFLSGEKTSAEPQHDIGKIKRNMQIFHLTQLTLFVIIIIVSVFRFG